MVFMEPFPNIVNCKRKEIWYDSCLNSFFVQKKVVERLVVRVLLPLVIMLVQIVKKDAYQFEILSCHFTTSETLAKDISTIFYSLGSES